MNSISPNTISPNEDLTTKVSNPTSDNKDLFIKMMMAEISNQDPLNPTDSSQYINQMSMLSIVQIVEGVTSEIEQLYNMEKSVNAYSVLQSAENLIGKNVTVKTDDEIVQGKVDGVNTENDKILLSINNKLYDFEDVVNINEQQEIKQ